jgi:hypothetical protein
VTATVEVGVIWALSNALVSYHTQGKVGKVVIRASCRASAVRVEGESPKGAVLNASTFSSVIVCVKGRGRRTF